MCTAHPAPAPNRRRLNGPAGVVSVLHRSGDVTSAGILFLTPWLSGGGIEHNLEVKAAWLARHGHRVAVASWGVAETLSGRPNPVLATLRNAGVRIVPVRRRAPLGLARMAAELAFLARRDGYDVLVGHELVANVVVILAKLVSGGRLRAVGEFHNDPATYRETGAGRALLAVSRRLYRHADRLVAVSELLRRQHGDVFGLPAARVTTVYNPFILDAIRAMKATPDPVLDALPPFIVGCGRLWAIKGFPDLIAGFARVHARHPGLRCVILGEGPDRELLTRVAATHGVADAVDLPGFVAQPERYLARARCFVLSSLNEGLPRVLFEAFAAATPVVSSRCGGVQELIEDGKTGLLYEPGDVAGLAQALDAVLGDDARAADLVRAATRRVEEFSVDRVLPQLEAAYLA